MGLFTEILLLPLAPVRGVVKLGEVIQRRAEQELNNPARTRGQLEELAKKRERGEISAEEEHEAQQTVLETKIAPKPIEEQSDPAGKAGEQSSGGQRRPTAGKSTGESPASVLRRRPRRSR